MTGTSQLASSVVTVTNGGLLVAHQVVLTNVLPAGLNLPMAAVAAGALFTAGQVAPCTLSGLTATCTLPDLPPGASAALVFSGVVPANATNGTTLTDSASVALAEVELDPSNNSSSAVTPVRVPGHLPFVGSRSQPWSRWRSRRCSLAGCS